MRNLPNVQLKTTTQLFLEMADVHSNRIRWHIPDGDNWHPVSWQTYRQNVCQIAAALHSLGFKYDDKIGILANNSIEWIYSALGIMVANIILVPIYAGNTPGQSLYIINHSDMKVLFVENPETVNNLHASRLDRTQLEFIILLSGETDDCESPVAVKSLKEIYETGTNYLTTHTETIHDLAQRIHLDNVAYMIYTSGTTGKPKGVPLSHRNLAVSTHDWLQINGPLIPETVVDIHWLPNSHIYGWGAVGLGNIFSFESFLGTPQNVLDLLPKLKPHIFMSVPAYFEKLYMLAISSGRDKNEQIDRLIHLTGGRLHFLLSGGAGLKKEVKEFFLEAGMWITEGYGLSECSPTLTMNRRDAYRFDSVGLPFPSVQLRLAEDGEILAKGDNVFSGYYKDSDATKSAFTSDGWFKTGDVGEWLEGGFLKITGRKSDMIVTSGGKNISPQNIELRFNDDPFIEHLIVYGDGEKYLVALVTLNQTIVRLWAKNNHVTFTDWNELCRHQRIVTLIQQSINRVNDTLPSYETIKKFLVIPDNFTPDNGLLTASLKVRRKEIYRKYRPELDTLYKEQESIIEE